MSLPCKQNSHMKKHENAIRMFMLATLLFLILRMCINWRKRRRIQQHQSTCFFILLDRRPERKKHIMDRIQEDPRYYIADITAVDGKKHLTENFINGHGQIGCFSVTLEFGAIESDAHLLNTPCG